MDIVADRFLCIGKVIITAQDQKVSGKSGISCPADHFQSVHARHADIHDRNVRAGREKECKGIHAVPGSSNQFQGQVRIRNNFF